MKNQNKTSEKKQKIRCSWASEEPNLSYHDQEWGVPVHDDRTLFEFLILEGAQAGLSWTTILKKREHYRKAFANFEPAKVARFPKSKLASLMKNDGIVRNRLKIESTLSNAKAFLTVQQEFGSFHRYIWQFVNNSPLQRAANQKTFLSRSPESDAMSKDLKKRGFRFVGTTICYAFMQACGLVNDHALDCFRRRARNRR